MELVDIVDKSGHIIRKMVSKQLAHEKGYLHKTVIAEIIDKDGNMTLVKQADHKQDAGQYVSPVGGHVRSSETDEEALKREAMEEIGIGNFDFKYIGSLIFNREVLGRKENHYFQIYEIRWNRKLVLNHESIEYRKFSQQELQRELKQNPHLFGEAFNVLVKTYYTKLL
ncbi:NUDIX hydrolase [Candidatus Roizmanbacteria bacterium]|nr:NUDIX hydrolase [Candidatus Roizmanbacteria bacterium]